MNSVERAVSRPEWTPEQREFLLKNPELALASDAYLDELDRKIKFLEQRKAELQESPFYWISRFFTTLLGEEKA